MLEGLPGFEITDTWFIEVTDIWFPFAICYLSRNIIQNNPPGHII